MKRFSGMVVLVTMMTLCVGTVAFGREETATVVGRFIIKNPARGQYKKHKQICFSERFSKKYNHLIKTADSGYFRMKLPLGYSYLEKLYYIDGGEFLKKFPSDYLEIRIDSPGRVYYIGDIVLTWDILIDDERPTGAGMGGGLIGGIISSSIQKNQEGRIAPQAMPVAITVNPESIQYFSKKLHIDESMFLTNPLHIKKKR